MVYVTVSVYLENEIGILSNLVDTYLDPEAWAFKLAHKLTSVCGLHGGAPFMLFEHYQL